MRFAREVPSLLVGGLTVEAAVAVAGLAAGVAEVVAVPVAVPVPLTRRTGLFAARPANKLLNVPAWALCARTFVVAGRLTTGCV